MRNFFFTLSVLALTPFLTHAAGLQGLLTSFIGFINRTLIPFLFGLAFLFFIINAIRYFVIEGTNDEGREKARNLAIYGVAAFVFITVFWGLVNLVASSTGLDGGSAPTADYMEINGATNKNPSSKSSGDAASQTTSADTACGALEQSFDNTFGGDCASGCGSLEKSFDNTFGGDCATSEEPPLDPNCPNGATGLGLDGRPCGIY